MNGGYISLLRNSRLDISYSLLILRVILFVNIHYKSAFKDVIFMQECYSSRSSIKPTIIHILYWNS